MSDERDIWQQIEKARDTAAARAEQFRAASEDAPAGKKTSEAIKGAIAREIARTLSEILDETATD